MKRFTAAFLAAATAVTLSTGAATAKTSSEVSDTEAGWHVTKAIFQGDDGFASSINKTADWASSKADDVSSSDIKEIKEISENSDPETKGSAKDFLWSTVKSDTAQDWKVGTTLEVIAGVSIAAIMALLGLGSAAAAGALPSIPGMQDIKLPR